MLKFIGAVALIGGAALGVAVYTDVLDFDATAKVTPKGEAQVQDLRNDAADFIRGMGESAGSAVQAPPAK